MKVNKFNIIWSVLFCSTIVFGQKQTKRIDENFKVNKDVLVEINARHSDVKVVTWNKNTVSIQGVWEIDGISKEDADKYFKGWEFEALGNKNKVVITSKSSNNYYMHYDVFDDMDFDFDFDFDLESISHIGEMFHGDYFSNLPSIPPLPAVSPLPPMEPMPVFPEPFVGHLKQIEFDYEAYQKDKDGYMKEFEKRQKVWQKEFEEKIEPQMEVYEKQMEEWQKKVEPQMKAYEEKIKQWEKEMEPKIKAHEKRIEARKKANEKRMEARMKVMDERMKKDYARKMKEKKAKMSKYKIRKNLLIKVPVGAKLKVNARYGKITLPDHIKMAN